MELDTQRIRELCDQRDAIDKELAGLFQPKERAPQKCGTCGEAGHTARTCSKRPTLKLPKPE